MTFLLVDLYTYINVEKRLDAQLKSFAEGISSNFREELGSITAQLWRFDKRVTKLAGKERTGALAEMRPSTLPEVPKPKVDAKKVSEFKANLLAGSLDWETAPYPYFNSVTWADTAGLQRIKWTTRPETTAFVESPGGLTYECTERQFWKQTTAEGSTIRLRAGELQEHRRERGNYFDPRAEFEIGFQASTPGSHH